MRICPKCFAVFPTSQFSFCLIDGSRTFDVASIEAEEAVEQLKKALKEGEKHPCSFAKPTGDLKILMECTATDTDLVYLEESCEFCGDKPVYDFGLCKECFKRK